MTESDESAESAQEVQPLGKCTEVQQQPGRYHWDRLDYDQYELVPDSDGDLCKFTEVDTELTSLRERVALLTEALEWLFATRPSRGGHSRAIACVSADGTFVYSGGTDKDIPAHLAKLIRSAAP